MTIEEKTNIILGGPLTEREFWLAIAMKLEEAGGSISSVSDEFGERVPKKVVDKAWDAISEAINKGNFDRLEFCKRMAETC